MAELEGKRREPSVTNLDTAIAILQSMNASLASASDSANTKAGLVPVAFAGVAALLVGHVHVDGASALLLGTGWVTVGLVAVSLVAAVAVLIPLTHEAGPSPHDIAMQTDIDELHYKARIVNRLAIAAADLADLVNAKGDWLRVSLLGAASAVAALFVFWAMGGLR